MSMIQMAKTAQELVDTRKEVEELKTKLADFEKRAGAEAFLIDMMSDARAPLSLKPSSVADFIEKRAAIEKVDLKTAELAVKMASAHGFEIGVPEEPTALYQSSGSKADDDFIDYLLGSQS
jgi:hypothetical protein